MLHFSPFLHFVSGIAVSSGATETGPGFLFCFRACQHIALLSAQPSGSIGSSTGNHVVGLGAASGAPRWLR